MRWSLHLLIILLAGLAGALLALGAASAAGPAPQDAAPPPSIAAPAPPTPVATASPAPDDAHCAGCRDDDDADRSPPGPAAATSTAPPDPAFADLAQLTLPGASGGLTVAVPRWPERCAVRFEVEEQVEGQETSARLAGIVAGTGSGGATLLEWWELTWQDASLAGPYRVGFEAGRLVVLPAAPLADQQLAAQLVQASRRLLLLRGHWPDASLTHGQDLDLGGVPYRVVVPTSDAFGLYAAACVASDGRYPATAQRRDEIAIVASSRALVSCRHLTLAAAPIGSRLAFLHIAPAPCDPIAQAPSTPPPGAP